MQSHTVTVAACARRRLHPFAILGLAALLCAPAMAQIGPGGPPQVTPPTPPPKFVPGPVTWLVSHGSVTHLPTNTTWTNDIDCNPNLSIGEYALAFALRRARPNDVLQVSGTVSGVQIVPVHTACKRDEAGWNGNIMRDVTIIGQDANATILGATSIEGRIDLPGQGGVDRLSFINLRLVNRFNDKTPLLIHSSSRNGRIRIYDSRFLSDDPTAWNGNGMMWGSRMYLTSADIRDCEFGRAQEHMLYIDSPNALDTYTEALIFVNNVATDFTGRTGVQIVNRSNPPDGYDPLPGRGDVLFYNNELHVDGSIGGGGSAFTCAGHWGRVFVVDNFIEANGAGSSNAGGILAWVPGQTWLMPSGCATQLFYVQDNIVFGTGTSPNIGAAGCEVVDIRFNTLMGGGTGVEFEGPFMGAIGNRIEALPPSNMSGWQQGGGKAKDKINGVHVFLTDWQIDNLY